MTINFIIAQIIGIFALIILMLSFQKNEKTLLLKYQIISSLLYAIQIATIIELISALIAIYRFDIKIKLNKNNEI